MGDRSGHHDALHRHSVLHQHGRFTTSDVTAGKRFEADVEMLREATRKWEGCLRGFNEIVHGNRLTSAIPDGTGPVAHTVGARFNHLMGATGGVGYATLAYVRQLEQILAGLNETTGNLISAEDQATTGFTNRAADR